MPAPGGTQQVQGDSISAAPKGSEASSAVALTPMISPLPFSGSSDFFPTALYPPQPAGSITEREGRLRPVRQQWGPRAGAAAEAAEQAARQGAAEEKMHLFYRRRVCTEDQTLLQPYSGVALLEQLLNGPVQTAAGEHQKVQRSPADKHLNCLILSYPRARLSSLPAHQLLATALPHTRASLHGDRFAQAVKGCLTGCRPGRFGIQRAVTCWITLRVESFRQRREGECGPGSGLEQASPRCSDPATVGSVSASSTLQ